MINKKILSKKRRSLKTRKKIKELLMNRLCVHRSLNNIYAQIISSCGKVLTSASTAEVNLKNTIKYGGNVQAASLVGKTIAERASLAGIKNVVFDRSGSKYHGRIKALADSARENGINF